MEIKKQICAVLAGYVWDESNPFVKKHNKIVQNLAYIINLEKITIKTDKFNKF